MTTIFTDGVLRLNLNNQVEKAMAVALAFDPSFKEKDKYIALEDAMPKFRGMSRKVRRMEFAFDTIQSLNEQGYEIVKKEK